MVRMVDHEQVVTQADFGEMVGISQQAVSHLVRIGALPATASCGEMLRAYCHRLREVAAGRGADGDLDLAQERAALARAQREGIEMKNAVARKQYAPVTLLAMTLATASQAVAERLEQLPGLLRRSCPDLPEAARTQLMTVIASARNEWVTRTVQLVGERLAEEEAAGDDVVDIDS